MTPLWLNSYSIMESFFSKVADCGFLLDLIISPQPKQTLAWSSSHLGIAATDLKHI